MKETTRLFITRHGETYWNLEGRVQGSQNSNLTDKGINQAKQLGCYLKETPIDIVYSSSSGRAMETSKAIIGDRKTDIHYMDDLQEMNMGIWEGLTFTTIKEKYKIMHEIFWGAPDQIESFPGETFDALRERAVKSILQIIEDNPGKSILIVTHGITLNILMAYFEERPLAKLFEEPYMHSTCLNEVEVQGDAYRIVRYAETEHYELEVS